MDLPQPRSIHYRRSTLRFKEFAEQYPLLARLAMLGAAIAIEYARRIIFEILRDGPPDGPPDR